MSGCKSSSTTLLVQVSSAKTSALTAVDLKVLGPKGVIGTKRVSPAPLPGQLTVQLPDESIDMRVIVATEDTPPVLNGVMARSQPHAQVTARLTLDGVGLPDGDGDGVPDTLDACIAVPDVEQANAAGGGAGDACRDDAGVGPDLGGGASVDLAAPGGDLGGSSGDLGSGSGVDMAGVPAVPSGVTATAGSAQVALSWSASAGAASYQVFRAASDGGPYTLIVGLVGTSYTDKNLTPGTTYYYVIVAHNGNGDSAQSAQVSATPPLVAAGTYQVVNVASGYVLDDDGDGPAGTQVIQWGYGSGSNQQWIFTPVGANYRITCNSNQLAASVNGSTTAGDPLTVQTASGSSSDQLWTLTKQGDGSYLITNVFSGKVIDNGGSNTEGHGITQATAGSTSHQHWSLQAP
jgi:hypothetical protein